MKRLFLAIIFIATCISIFPDNILAKVNKDTSLYADYGQKESIGIIRQNEVVQIENEVEAHNEDDEYLGFSYFLNDASIRVKHKGITGYISFYDLQSVDEYGRKILHKFSDKYLVPISYCNTLYNMNSKYTEETDLFVLKYDELIKYCFITDVHKEWYYNYPINRSFVNDLYFQFTAIPYRYNLSGFITRCTKNTITCIIDDNYDQLQLYSQIAKFTSGRKYAFGYSIDGDYIKIYYESKVVFSGAFIERATWEYVFNFMKKRLMKSKEEQSRNDEYFSKESIDNLTWPIHANGLCDYKKG